MKVRTTLREEFMVAAPGRVRFEEPMRLHTSFHIGGPAEIWAEPQDPEELRRFLRIAAEAAIPVTMVGGGANLLVRDEGIPGLVVHLSGPGFQSIREMEEGVAVGAALPLEWLIRRSQEASLSGVEFLAGVPGHVGRAVRMNAGTHDDEGKFHHFGDCIQSIQVMDLDGQVRLLPAEAIDFAYRSTNLNGRIVLSATLKLSRDDPKAIAERVQRLWAFKKSTQDWSAPSVGCIFKNPSEKSAGWMIDQAGLKGYQVGGAMISTRHANFMLNFGNGRAADVFSLIEEARARVLRKFGVKLELEVQVLP